MGYRKLLRFQDNERRTNVIQPGKEMISNIKGNWRKLHFKNDNEIVLELACGRGEYTIGLARAFPEKNFVGVDIKGSRIWSGSSIAEKEELTNVAMLRVIIQNLEEYFEKEEINEIWIIHPDPRSKGSDEHRRLTHPRFLDIYRRLLKPGSWVHMKTDNMSLFEYSLGILKSHEHTYNLEYTFDLYSSPYAKDHLGIKTHYERMSLDDDIKIKYLKFRVN